MNDRFRVLQRQLCRMSITLSDFVHEGLREQQRERQPATTMLSPSHPRSFATKPFGLKPWWA
jgi:hypothetical protein